MRTCLLTAVLLVAVRPSDARAGENWPQFRGGDSRGVASGARLPDRWSASQNVAWKCDLPGRGWSSPIVWKDRVFLTTVINTGKAENIKKGLYFGGDRPQPPDAVHQWQVFCLDLSTGKVLWKKQVHEGKPQTSIHLKSSYASETPVTDGERVYCYFGNLGVFCFDLDGKEVWTRKTGAKATRYGWGTASSPVLHQGRLYLVNDNEKDSYLLALDAKTGKEVWRVARDEKSNWSTPFVWKNKKRTEIVTPGTSKVRSYDLDGNLLWWLKGMSSITIATPYEDNGLLYISSGYVLDLARPIYAIRPGAKGDVSLKEDESSNEFIAWSLPRAAPYNPTTLSYNHRLYVLYDRGTVGCFDSRDGKSIFASKRLPNGRAFTSSPWAYDGKVFCLNEDGVTFVLKDGKEFALLHTNTLAADDTCLATPAIAGDRLLIRTAARVYCIRDEPLSGKEKREPPAKELTSAITAADWPTYNHDPAGWRFNPAEKTLGPTNVGKLVEKWRFPAASSKETIGVVHATPAVVHGELYFGTATFSAFYKLDKDGKQRWVYRNPARKTDLPPAADNPDTGKLRAAVTEGGIFSSALVAGGGVYFADVAGWIYCLDAHTGKERWKLSMRSAPFPGAHWNNLTLGSPILADGKIVLGGGTLEQTFAGTKKYPGSTGRGFVVALDPKSGKVVWKYDVGEDPKKLVPSVTVKDAWGEYTFTHGPATSSVWCTPSYDPESRSLFFGTDVNTAPRQPTRENPKLATEDSDAIVCLDVATGKRKWSTQLYPGDLWTNAMRGWDSKTGLYKDCSIGDTPKIFSTLVDGKQTKVVGAGCKNGGFYLLRADNGKLVKHTPLYTGKPTHPAEKHDPRVLALPSPIGGLQTGCATDGQTIFTNGIDAVRLTTQASRRAAGQLPTGGRVTATSVDLKTEVWRHERPKIARMGGTAEKPMHTDVGDVVGSGVAVGNGVAYFTTVGSGKLVALAAASGKVLKEIELGPVWSGPSLSTGRVYVGGGNTLFTPSEYECFFPKKYTGSVRCFGLPEEGKKGEEQPTPKTPARPPLPDDVEKRSVKIFSNGTRMAGDLYLPKGRKREEKLPAVVLCAGTGGTKENTGGRLGPILAQHGYIVLAFDYRGWGESESQLMAVAAQPRPDAKNEMTIKVRALRGQMNYTDQTEDVRAAISYLVGEPGVDRKRIGLWGTSYGGGLVTWVAGNDPRIKCFVAQVPGMGVGGPAMTKAGYDLATKQARGETEPVPVETGKLTGALARYKDMRRNPARSVGFSVVDAATRIKIPALFVVAEKEELASNDLVERVHKDLVKRGVSSTYHVLKGMTHYGVYNKGFKEATRVEVEWLDVHLKK